MEVRRALYFSGKKYGTSVFSSLTLRKIDAAHPSTPPHSVLAAVRNLDPMNVNMNSFGE